MTRETVAGETPARAATSEIVADPDLLATGSRLSRVPALPRLPRCRHDIPSGSRPV